MKGQSQMQRARVFRLGPPGFTDLYHEEPMSHETAQDKAFKAWFYDYCIKNSLSGTDRQKALAYDAWGAGSGYGSKSLLPSIGEILKAVPK